MNELLNRFIPKPARCVPADLPVEFGDELLRLGDRHVQELKKGGLGVAVLATTPYAMMGLCSRAVEGYEGVVQRMFLSLNIGFIASCGLGFLTAKDNQEKVVMFMWMLLGLALNYLGCYLLS